MTSLEEFSNAPGYYRLVLGDIITADTEYLPWCGGVYVVGDSSRLDVGRVVNSGHVPLRRPGVRTPPSPVSSRPPANVRMAKVTPINLP